jgi:L-rhamnose isomerase
MTTIESAFKSAQERYLAIGVDAAAAIAKLAGVPISLNCWQGDDVAGFEGGGALGDGLAVTGSYPGKARNGDELRADLDEAYRLIPGRHRLNLHALYAECGGERIDRDALETKHFSRWIDWAKATGHGIDQNPSYFSHPKSSSGFTLAHQDAGIRRFWVDHGIAMRNIAADTGRALGTPCVNNVWIPDGLKDLPADRKAPRERLTESLDAIFAEPKDAKHLRDAVEPKLFGIGSESYVVGSYDYYLGYALSRKKVLCLDSGHFHPTEVIGDKISSVFSFVSEVLLHVSRGVRWDSDHVVILNDEILLLAQELVRGDFLGRTHIGLDFFDASINRVAAWVIGTRSTQKGLLRAMLDPIARMKEAELAGDFTTRLCLGEEAKSLPWGAVWDYFCELQGAPVGEAWLTELKKYEQKVLAAREAPVSAKPRAAVAK